MDRPLRRRKGFFVVSNEQENEQEFDAESLAALARSSIAAPPPTKSVPPAAGVKDDSGLINLKALAEQASTDADVTPDLPSASNGKSPAAAESTRPAARSAARPAAQGSAAAHAPAVVAAPPAPAPARSNALIYMLGFVALAAIGAWIYVNRTPAAVEPTEPTTELDEGSGPIPDEPSTPPAPSEPASQAVAAATPPTTAEPTTPTSPDPAATSAAPAADPTAVAAAPADEGRDRDQRERDRERERRDRERAAAAAAGGAAATPAAPATAPVATPARTEPAPARTEPAPAGQAAATKRGSSVDDLLDQALGGRPAAGGVGTREQPRQREEAPSADLPDVPPRSAITSALGRLRRSIENCANGQVGVARAEVTFGSDGSVSSVTISGAPFAGTPQGACMQRVVQRARVPRFRRSSLTITYPYSVRPPEP